MSDLLGRLRNLFALTINSDPDVENVVDRDIADAIDEIERLHAEVESLRAAIVTLYAARYRNGTHGSPPMVSVDAEVWRQVGIKFFGPIDAAREAGNE